MRPRARGPPCRAGHDQELETETRAGPPAEAPGGTGPARAWCQGFSGLLCSVTAASEPLCPRLPRDVVSSPRASGVEPVSLRQTSQ